MWIKFPSHFSYAYTAARRTLFSEVAEVSCGMPFARTAINSFLTSLYDRSAIPSHDSARDDCSMRCAQRILLHRYRRKGEVTCFHDYSINEFHSGVLSKLCIKLWAILSLVWWLLSRSVNHRCHDNRHSRDSGLKKIKIKEDMCVGYTN